MEERVSLREIFLLSFRLSMFTFGGGFVMISMMQKEFSEKRGWIDPEEMQDISVIAQSAPGAVAVNAIIMLGRKLRGTAGIAAAVSGTLIPPLIILSLISIFYTEFKESLLIAAALRGMRAAVAAIVLEMAIDLCISVIKIKNKWNTALMIISFICVFAADISAVTVVLVCFTAAVIRTLYEMLRDRKGRLS